MKVSRSKLAKAHVPGEREVLDLNYRTEADLSPRGPLSRESGDDGVLSNPEDPAGLAHKYY